MNSMQNTIFHVYFECCLWTKVHIPSDIKQSRTKCMWLVTMGMIDTLKIQEKAVF